MYCTISDICAIELLFRYGQRNCLTMTGKVREFCCRKPVGTLVLTVCSFSILIFYMYITAVT